MRSVQPDNPTAMLSPVKRRKKLEQTDKLLFTKKECALMLSLSARTIDNLIATKELPVRRIGRRVLIHRTSLEKFAVGSVRLVREARYEA
jgi:excisionase family DNA binding protein